MARSDAVSSRQASEQGRPPEHTSKFYAKGALQYLVPILTQTLTKQVAPQHNRWRVALLNWSIARTDYCWPTS